MKDSKGTEINVGDLVVISGEVATSEHMADGYVRVAIKGGDGSGFVHVPATEVKVVARGANQPREPIVGEHHDPSQRMWGLDEHNQPLYSGQGQ